MTDWRGIPVEYRNKIVTGDCWELLYRLPSDSIDLVVTSPPYGDLRDYEGFTFDFRATALQLYRAIKKGGVLVWVVGDKSISGSESGASFRQALEFMEVGFNLHDTMIYQKKGPAYPAKDRYYQVFEYMFVLSRGKPQTFNPIKDRKNRWYGQKWGKTRTRRKKSGELHETPWHVEEGSKMGVRFNVWKYNVGHGYHGDKYCHEHPASFPESLAKDHIISWSNPNDIVLDPMCGSGTTCKMAKETGRRWMGFDISEKYVELSRKRMKGALIPLFK